MGPLDRRIRIVVRDRPTRGSDHRGKVGPVLVDRIVWAKRSERLALAVSLEPEGFRPASEVAYTVRGFRVPYRNRGNVTPVPGGHGFLIVDPEDRVFSVGEVREMERGPRYLELVVGEVQTRIAGGRPTYSGGVPAGG